jgi:hypothetical protein
MFLTGYEDIVIPTQYDDAPRMKKPFNYDAVMECQLPFTGSTG